MVTRLFLSVVLSSVSILPAAAGPAQDPAAAAPAAPAGPSDAEVARALDALGTSVAAAEASFGQTSAECLASVNVASLIDSAGTALAESPSSSWHMRAWASCRAIASNDPGVCAVVKRFEPDPVRVNGCRSEVSGARLLRALVKNDPGASAACQEYLRIGVDGQRVFKDSALAQVCQTLLQSRNDPAAACRVIVDPTLYAPGGEWEAKECPPTVVPRFNPTAQSCATVSAGESHGYDGMVCAENARFKSSGGDRAKCGDSGWCLALAGAGPESCDSILKPVAQDLCAGGNKSFLGTVRTREAESKSAAAQRIVAKSKSPAHLKRLSALRQRLNKLQTRLDLSGEPAKAGGQR